jgi:hypothetical protein
MAQITPPQTDEMLDRHRFYATVATSLSYDKDADEAAVLTRNRLHARVDEVANVSKQSADALSEIKTQARTLASIASVVWLILGGGVSWYLDKTITKLDNYIGIIEKDQRKIEDLEKEVATLQSQKESIDALKRVTGTLQTEIDELNTKRNPLTGPR